MKPGQKGYNRSTLILGRICKEDGRIEEARDYLKTYLLNGPISQETLPAMKFALNFLEEVGDLESCMTGMKRLQEAKMLDKELEDKLHQLEIRHVQTMLGEAIPFEAWIRKGTEPQVVGMDVNQIQNFLGNRYLIDKKLKDTGAVTIFSARSRQDKTEVRIRVLHAWKMVVKPELKRVMDDTKRVRELNHPNVLQTIEGSLVENAPYVITQAPRGTLLQTILMDRANALSSSEIIKIVSGKANALDYIHKNGFIHKGFSPSCIYIGKDGNAVLSGLGVPDARFDKQGPIHWGDPVFLSPEAKMGRMVTKASDLYGFALLIINLMLGKLPYKPKEAAVDIERALTELRKMHSGLPLGIWALLQMSLSVEPRERPKSASAIAREVVNALSK
jgi:serine/threonine protein kinase